MDAMLFENFLFNMLLSIRQNPSTMNKKVVIMLDNVSLHRHESVKKTAIRFGATLLFNCAYSPFLNPIE